jgi:hypothetical protein
MLRYSKTPKGTAHSMSALQGSRSPLVIDRSLYLEKQVQTEFWQLHTWLCGSSRIRPVVICERRTLKRIFIAERLPERHLGDEKPPVKSNFVFQHLAWCIDVWIPALELIVERRFVCKRWFLTVLKQPISAAIGARSSHPSGEYR